MNNNTKTETNLTKWGLPYDPYDVSTRLGKLDALIRVAVVSDIPAVQQALQQLEAVAVLSHAEDLKVMEKKGSAIVHIVESERGWGRKVDEVLTIRTKDEAAEFVRAFNRRNTTTETPDYYVQAEIANW